MQHSADCTPPSPCREGRALQPYRTVYASGYRMVQTVFKHVAAFGHTNRTRKMWNGTDFGDWLRSTVPEEVLRECSMCGVCGFVDGGVELVTRSY